MISSSQRGVQYVFYIDVLLEAVGNSRRSGRDISIAAVGHASAVRDVKRRRDLRASTLEALCRELDLEFYIGPPRAVPAGIARALGLPDTCSVEDALVAINLHQQAGPVESGGSLFDLAEGISAAVRAHRAETQNGFAELMRAIGELGLDLSARPGYKYIAAPFIDGSQGVSVNRLALPLWADIRSLITLDVCQEVVDPMEPTVRDAELVIVDLSQGEPVDEEIFVVASEVSPIGLSVKRTRKADDGWWLCGDNAERSPLSLNKNHTMIGRIAWHGPKDSGDLSWVPDKKMLFRRSKARGHLIEAYGSEWERRAIGHGLAESDEQAELLG